MKGGELLSRRGLIRRSKTGKRCAAQLDQYPLGLVAASLADQQGSAAARVCRPGY